MGESKSDDMQEIEKKLSKKAHFKLRDLYSFPLSFWLIVLISFAFGGCWAPFLQISP